MSEHAALGQEWGEEHGCESNTTSLPLAGFRESGGMWRREHPCELDAMRPRVSGGKLALGDVSHAYRESIELDLSLRG